jgi:Protein of unknown function (DUF1573)
MIKKFLVLLCLFISVSYSQLLGPKIVFQEKEYDFGTVVQGEKVKHSFVVTNTGDDTLKIGNVHASCGCTAALPDKKELLPGESTNIKVEFNSTGRTGSQVKYISVKSNDKETPEFSLKFYGEVVKEQTEKKKDTSSIPKEKSN